MALSIAALASRAWSALFVYRCTSLKLAWPVIAAISCMVHPASARRRATERYAAPVIARAIAPHRGGHASEMDGKAVLDHLISAGLIAVGDVKLRRGGGRSDTRQGLVLTSAGKMAVQQVIQVAPTNPTPQSPQCPAVTLQDDAGGEPLGSPATPRGCGGYAGHVDAVQVDTGAADPSAGQSSFPVNKLSQNDRDGSSSDGQHKDRADQGGSHEPD